MQQQHENATTDAVFVLRKILPCMLVYEDYVWIYELVVWFLVTQESGVWNRKEGGF